MAKNKKLQHWLQTLWNLIVIAEKCEKQCPMLHRLKATAHGIEILIEKEKEKDDNRN